MRRTYTVTFERIGRKHDVSPLVVEADNLDDLAEHVYRYARPHLMSRDVEVVVSNDGPGDETGRGVINCGWQLGGSFTVTSEATS